MGDRWGYLGVSQDIGIRSDIVVFKGITRSSPRIVVDFFLFLRPSPAEVIPNKLGARSGSHILMCTSPYIAVRFG